jgi:hypothetical protein
MLAKFRKLFNSMNEDDRKLVFFLLQKMVGREHTVSSNRRSDSHGSQVAPLP